MIDTFASIPVVEADYDPEHVPEIFQGHPFIEALPIYKPERALLSRMLQRPTLPSDISRYSADQRILLLVTLKEVYVPGPRDGRMLEVIKSAIAGVHHGRYLSCQDYYKRLANQEFVAPKVVSKFRPSVAILSGESGSGKTSVCHAILGLIPQVIQHYSYKGHHFDTKQVTWVKIDCPSNDETTRPLLDIIEQVYSLFGIEIDLEMTIRQKRGGTGYLLKEVSSLFLKHGTAVLVIDNTENITSHSVKVQKRLMAAFFNIYEKSGVLVIVVGTPELKRALSRDKRVLRRSIEQEVYDWEALDGAAWYRFISVLWKVQLLKVATPLTSQLSEILRVVSNGLPGVASPIFRNVQAEAIRRGKINPDQEVITPELIFEEGERIWSWLNQSSPSNRRPFEVQQMDMLNEDCFVESNLFEADDNSADLDEYIEVDEFDTPEELAPMPNSAREELKRVIANLDEGQRADVAIGELNISVTDDLLMG